MHDVNALAKRLAVLDMMYSGWVPGFTHAHGERIAKVRSSIAERGVGFALGLRASLPSSIVRRALAIESLAPKRVLLFGDVDGLAGFLASDIAATVVEPTRTIAEVVADVAVVEVVDLGPTIVRLESALVAVGPSGTVLARLRWPWDRAFYEHIKVLGLKVLGYERDVDHALLPGGFVVDGAGDLVLLGGAIAASAPELPRPLTTGTLSMSLSASADAPPYAWFDMDGLAPDRAIGLNALANEVARISKRTPELADVKTYDDREVLCWYDTNGRGFVAELSRDSSHLLVSYVPYDDALDHAVITSAFTLFADEDTRLRPRRTERTPQRTVFS